MLEAARGLFAEAQPLVRERGLTLIGVALTNLADDLPIQLRLPFEPDDRVLLDEALDEIRDRYGTTAVTRAVLLGASRPRGAAPSGLGRAPPSAVRCISWLTVVTRGTTSRRSVARSARRRSPPPALHPMLELQRVAGNEAGKAAAAGENMAYGKYAWAGGVLAGGGGRAAALAWGYGGPGPGGLRSQPIEGVIRNAGANWNAVKARYLEDERVMRNIVAYRKWFVDSLIDELRTDKRFADMKTRAAGSTALSSDYDITFMGEKGAEAVQEFNSRFRAHWGKEAGTVFDTNVYAEDVLPGKEVVLSGEDDITKLGATGGTANVDARLDEGLQDVASLVKVRKNMTRTAWEAFTGRILQRLARDADLVLEAASRFAQANTTFERTYVQEIIAQLEQDPNGRARVNRLRAQGKSNIAVVEDVMGDDQGIAASNRVYEEKLLYAAELEERRKGAPSGSREWKSLTEDLRKAKADAMLFANEPYFSAGTLYHVVGNTQAKFGAVLSSAALFQSLQENYGDTLKELHHLHDKPWAVVAIKSSKYVWRMLDAAVGLQGEGRHDRRRSRRAPRRVQGGTRRAPGSIRRPDDRSRPRGARLGRDPSPRRPGDEAGRDRCRRERRHPHRFGLTRRRGDRLASCSPSSSGTRFATRMLRLAEDDDARGRRSRRGLAGPGGGGDRFSDLDLTFAVADDMPVADVLDDWTRTLVDELDAVRLADLERGPTIYRVFLLPDALQFDLSLTPAPQFRPAGPAIPAPVRRDGAGRARVPRAAGTRGDLFGWGVIYALHSRSCIERGRLWQAEHYVGAVRDHALALACLREGLPAVQARGYDDLSAETLARFEDTHVGALEPEALRAALAAAVVALLREGEAGAATARSHRRGATRRPRLTDLRKGKSESHCEKPRPRRAERESLGRREPTGAAPRLTGLRSRHGRAAGAQGLRRRPRTRRRRDPRALRAGTLAPRRAGGETRAGIRGRDDGRARPAPLRPAAAPGAPAEPACGARRAPRGALAPAGTGDRCGGRPLPDLHHRLAPLRRERRLLARLAALDPCDLARQERLAALRAGAGARPRCRGPRPPQTPERQSPTAALSALRPPAWTQPP